MSSSLVYVPLRPKEPDKGGWGQPLKGIICKRFFDEYGDGSLTYREHQIMTVEKDEQFLLGLIAAGNKQLEEQAGALLDALREHEAIELWIE